MTDIIITKIVFGTLLTIEGSVLLFISFKVFYKYLVQEKRCTKKTKGIVKRYTFSSRGGENSGIHLPIVYYTVNQKEYKVTGPEYKAYKTIKKSSPLEKNTIRYKEDNQILTINRTSNSFIGIYKNPIQELYPINTLIDVYYDPNNPKLAYVLRYCNKKWLFWCLFINSLFVFALDIITLIVL